MAYINRFTLKDFQQRRGAKPTLPFPIPTPDGSLKVVRTPPAGDSIRPKGHGDLDPGLCLLFSSAQPQTDAVRFTVEEDLCHPGKSIGETAAIIFQDAALEHEIGHETLFDLINGTFGPHDLDPVFLGNARDFIDNEGNEVTDRYLIAHLVLTTAKKTDTYAEIVAEFAEAEKRLHTLVGQHLARYPEKRRAA